MLHTERFPGGEAPERPSLAPGVELVGELRETGFVDRQWLVRREGRFVQLTELLYRVLEQADGRRTPEEMAAGATASTDWMVGADDVRLLVRDKLAPMGLVTARGEADAAGGTLPGTPPGTPRRGPSPLGFGMRAEILGPRPIEAVSKVLRFLFAPVILVPVLIAVALAHAWLYLVHGVTPGIREVIQAPGLLLAVLGLSIFSSVFHEFGHAAALRYGGGRARAMGAGIYLIYPAFYTDTTDSYRLGRWARVRTDLGGFYFHLIFALGAMGLYAATGWEFLLLLVLVVNLDIFYQCLPVVRFDGYWALADLTGIPDFFSQMGAFWRSILPLPRWRGVRLPRLKPWVKAVFVLYSVVTVPALALFLFLLVTRLPGIATAAWRSLLAQVGEFTNAMDAGDGLGMAASAAQAFVLELQMVGIAYLIYSLVWTSIRALLRRVRAAGP